MLCAILIDLFASMMLETQSQMIGVGMTILSEPYKYPRQKIFALISINTHIMRMKIG